MAWRTIDLPGAQIEVVDSAAVFNLGQTCKGRSTSTGYIGEFMYAQGASSVAAGSWVLLNHTDNVVSLLVDVDTGPVGVSMAAVIASTFGWFQTKGRAEANLAASCADNADLYTTATAGAVDDVVTGQYQIWGARCAETVTSAAVGEVEISDPVVAGPDAG
jgi:hypothetical protein